MVLLTYGDTEKRSIRVLMRAIHILECRRLIVKQGILLLVARIDVQILEEEDICVMFARLHVPIRPGVVILGEIDGQLHLDFRKALGKSGAHGIPLCLGLSRRLAVLRCMA